MMIRAQSHHIHPIARTAAKQVQVEVRILRRKVMMMRHLILLSGINLQLLLCPSFPLMITSHANLQLNCHLHYTKLTPSKFSFQKVCVYSLHSVQTKESTCITSKINTMIPHTDEGEGMILLVVMFVMCYNRVPNLSDYWSNNSSLGNQFIKNAISRNRFQFLMSKLYCNHPEKPDSAAKLYYVEELVNCMKQSFSNSMSETSHQSIDESMVKFKESSVLKQYLPLKPIKR